MTTNRIETPAANWREEGAPDPHGARYDCERSKLPMGHLTDDEIANEVFLHDHRTSLESMAYLTAAKERIRWLSRQLVAEQSKNAELKENAGNLADMLNDKIVTMQAAFIDAEQKGPAAGMQWITNSLLGPGLIPDESEPWANNAQHYYSHHCSKPLGPCGVCGAPSCVDGVGHVACSMEHYKQLKGSVS